MLSYLTSKIGSFWRTHFSVTSEQLTVISGDDLSRSPVYLLPVWIPSAVGIRQSSSVTPRQHTAATAYSTSLHHSGEAEFGQPTALGFRSKKTRIKGFWHGAALVLRSREWQRDSWTVRSKSFATLWDFNNISCEEENYFTSLFGPWMPIFEVWKH